MFCFIFDCHIIITCTDVGESVFQGRSCFLEFLISCQRRSSSPQNNALRRLERDSRVRDYIVLDKRQYTPCHPPECQAMYPLHKSSPESDPQASPHKLLTSAKNHSLCSHLRIQGDLHESSWPCLGRIFYGKEDRYGGLRRTDICGHVYMKFSGVIGVENTTYARAAEYVTTWNSMWSLSYRLPCIRVQADITTAGRM